MKVMMKRGKLLYLAILPLCLISCIDQSAKPSASRDMKIHLDSLEHRITELEKRSLTKLSVLMNRVQLHHSRLWEPGVRQNWKLSGYEFSKLKESLDEINSVYGENVHGNSTMNVELTALNSVLDSLYNAIKANSKDDFVSSYQSLTRKCNDCHQKAALDFYEIISPKTPAYSNEIE